MPANKIIIKEFQREKEMIAVFSLIKQLNPDLKISSYKKYLQEMLKNGYRMVGAFEDDTCVGLSGFWISTKIYSGKYLEVDNFIVDKAHRSKKIGSKLCKWMEQTARKNNCETLMLDAYAENIPAHKFYYREGYYVRGFHFLKKVK